MPENLDDAKPVGQLMALLSQADRRLLAAS